MSAETEETIISSKTDATETTTVTQHHASKVMVEREAPTEEVVEVKEAKVLTAVEMRTRNSTRS